MLYKANVLVDNGETTNFMPTNEIDKIFEKLTPDQLTAVHHFGSHARLLAGPGSGKTLTLTYRVLSLILKQNIDPESILLLTFTRMAARQLKEKLEEVLKPHDKTIPTVSTFHSFALRQILFNSRVVDTLPSPVRIADDWEQRHIILEDLKVMLGLKEIDDVKDLLNRLSADWGNLNADEQGWEESFKIPKFISAFRNHKILYGETLRAELVYQLKKCLNQNGQFKLDKDYKYILIDEYQDLNPCDLAIVKEFADKGAELYVVGDDDQSIYGFRYANPRGIRDFPVNYNGVKKLALEICYRCDKKILSTAEFVANLDRDRLPKPIKPRDDAEDGEVKLLRFDNQYGEAKNIAGKIKSLIDSGMSAKEIVLLFRGSVSKLVAPFVDEFKKLGIPYTETIESEIEDNKEYRIILSLFRLVSQQDDSLALRTLLQLEKNNLGDKCIESVHSICNVKKISFAQALEEIRANPSIIKQGEKVNGYIQSVNEKLVKYNTIEKLGDLITQIVKENMTESPLREKVLASFEKIISGEDQKLADFLRSLSVASDTIEQDIEGEGVNLLTMHQAKGLTYDVCFIVGLEDEYLPGRYADVSLDDERRLLYVSMTRARHKLYMTYCNKRIADQRHTGSNSGVENRNLTRFLRDIPSLTPQAISGS